LKQDGIDALANPRIRARKKKPARMAVGLAIICGALASPAAAEGNRGLTQAELENGLRFGAMKAPGQVERLDSGAVVDELRVSADGRWIVYTAFASDIRNNEIWMVASDGSTKKKVDSPYGYKNTPTLWGGRKVAGVYRPLSVFVSLAGGAKANFVDGVYFRSLEDKSAPWTLWERGDFRDLSLSQDEAYLMASTGKWNSATVRSTVRVWPLGPEGEKKGDAYAIAPSLKGQIHRIAMSSDSKTLIFECTVDKPGSYYGQSTIHSAPNKPGAEASLLFEDASGPVLHGEISNYTLFFVRGGGSVQAWRIGSDEAEEVIGFDGLYPNGMAYDRAKKRLVLGLQLSGSVASVIAIPLR